MKFAIKLNIMGIIYAFIMFINIELMLNIYRISRITGWDLHRYVAIVSMIMISGFILCTFLFYKLIKNWIGGRKASFFASALWIPYFILFVYGFASLFPITNGADKSNPITGLIILGELILYPIYLTLINFISISSINTV